MAAQPIQIVEYFRRFTVPLRTRWNFVARKLGTARRWIRLRGVLVARFSRQCGSANDFIQRRKIVAWAVSGRFGDVGVFLNRRRYVCSPCGIQGPACQYKGAKKPALGI